MSPPRGTLTLTAVGTLVALMAAVVGAAANINVSVMDFFISTIPEDVTNEVFAKFKHPVLTKIDGQPTYAKLDKVRNEVYANAISIKSPFSGGRQGCLGRVANDALYATETGSAWNVTESEGIYPTFPAGDTDTQKKAIVSTFIKTETDIKTIEVVETLLRNQVLDAIDEAYMLELKENFLGYKNQAAKSLLEHFTNYAKMDDQTLRDNRTAFKTAPDLTRLIEVYFLKQERCQHLATDGEVPISEADMAMQLGLHMAETGMVNTAKTKWKKRPRVERTRTNVNANFSTALQDMNAINKLKTGEAVFIANAAIEKGSGQVQGTQRTTR